ncbi:MAG: GyrI-like domain-containing protein [Dehalococcoidales bacterium]|nr:GyrI-like domain-containing protein [Dehalococcoidales bacterium]
MAPRKSKTDPQIIEMPARKMAVVYGKGAPDKVFARVFPALFGAVYTLKFDLKKRGLPTFKVEPPRSRYPDVLLVPQDEWTIVTGVPIPADTTSLPQKIGSPEVKIEEWAYGTVGQILHIGGYDKEQESIEKLLRLIEESGYEIAGPHEEEYLTKPDSKVVKTIIRYRIKKK